MKFNEFIKKAGQDALDEAIDDIWMMIKKCRETGEPDRKGVNSHVMELFKSKLQGRGKAFDDQTGGAKINNVLVTWKKSMLKNFWIIYVEDPDAEVF